MATITISSVGMVNIEWQKYAKTFYQFLGVREGKDTLKKERERETNRDRQTERQRERGRIKRLGLRPCKQ